MNRVSVWSDFEPAAGTPMPAYRIQRRSRLTYREFIQHHVRGSRPVVITDAATNWPALAKWTPAFFKERFGAICVNVEGDGQPLAAFTDDMKASRFDRPGRYASFTSIPRQCPSLLGDIDPRPSYWSPNWLESRLLKPFVPEHMLTNSAGLEITMGGAGSARQIHCHRLQTETFIVQIHGRQESVLYPPDQASYLYPKTPVSPVSQLTVREGVDLDRFPKFRDARPVRFFMEPGEMFYIPPGWWHTTRALTPSIALAVTIARGPIWWGVTRSACAWTWHADQRAWPIVYARTAGLFACMTAFAAVRAALDAVSTTHAAVRAKSM